MPERNSRQHHGTLSSLQLRCEEKKQDPSSGKTEDPEGTSWRPPRNRQNTTAMVMRVLPSAFLLLETEAT